MKSRRITLEKTKSKHQLKAKEKVKKEAQGPVQVLSLANLKPPLGSHKKRKLLGRGPGSGHGKTSTRGSKGQTSRAGRHFYAGFEGGQTPLIRRIAKRGFTSKFRKEYQIVNIKDLDKIKEPVIGVDLLVKNGLIRNKYKPVKILGRGEIKNPLTVKAHAFSRRAGEQIRNAGGTTEIINA